MENINTTPETLTQSLNSPIQQMPKENNIFKHLFTITVIILLILIILFFLILIIKILNNLQPSKPLIVFPKPQFKPMLSMKQLPQDMYIPILMVKLYTNGDQIILLKKQTNLYFIQVLDCHK
mgnify:CR=1 FL=1